MACGAEAPFSLLSLEEELSCSICLSPFHCPVTIPCGHNFCQDCLLSTWRDSYSCPQCRTVFATRPELRKNTVLSTVVETFTQRSQEREREEKGGVGGVRMAGVAEAIFSPPGEKEEEAPVIRCDTCMEAEAARTCLTCMASYCEEHLRPHRENPVFRPHQLAEPVGDLAERVCPHHHKLLELFCRQHGSPVCSLCLQQGHRACSFCSPEEQRRRRESDLKSNLGLLDGKIAKNEVVISQMKEMELKLKDSAAQRKGALSAEFQLMRDLLSGEELVALGLVDQEVESGRTKIRGLVSKFTENIDNMNKAKQDIQAQLNRSRTLGFLQASFTLPQAVNFDPYTPRLSLDSKKVLSSEAFAAGLHRHLTHILQQPVEARILRADGSVASAPGCSALGPTGLLQEPELRFPPVPVRLPRPASPASQAKAAQKKKTQKSSKKPAQPPADAMGKAKLNKSIDNLLNFGEVRPRGRTPSAEPRELPDHSDSLTKDISTAEKRAELLKYGSVLTFDPRTAHKRIALSEGFTKASVSDEHMDYPDCAQRFSVCSQVLTSKGFSAGRHYWEVRLSSNNFTGLGLAYGSIDRKGPASRLGRNHLSWCVEWFNVKLSAWHSSSETVLANPSPKRVGVLLDCDQGRATFYNVADRAYPFHSFQFPCTEPVYPAFWMFSSGSFITICKLQ
ncbi:E3 ubiquitin/ISG15 ligase TRIM25-like [Menidia menidia]